MFRDPTSAVLDARKIEASVQARFDAVTGPIGICDLATGTPPPTCTSRATARSTAKDPGRNR
jgi:hypothetical protein